ncbi:MAG: hypothetical protein ACR2OE_06130 [Thermomicrobiales bacterium]
MVDDDGNVHYPPPELQHDFLRYFEGKFAASPKDEAVKQQRHKPTMRDGPKLFFNRPDPERQTPDA